MLAFGRLPGSPRRFLVRELVDGRSLEEVIGEAGGASAREWLLPLASAADQLTVLHRAGLLHGDIKPANIIVGGDGAGTLVDLGLATPWREGGSRARGLTPKYAAPELLLGEPLTVRAEVYALGATLSDALSKRRGDLDEPTRGALARIAARATEEHPEARYPSVDELGSALKSAAKIETRALAAAWPVLGADAAAQSLAAEVARLGPGQGLAIVGPRRSGRSTLANRLSWSLGVSGAPVASVEPARDAAVGALEVVELELDAWRARGHEDVARSAAEPAAAADLIVVVDDLDGLDDAARARIRRAAEEGARVVAVGDEDAVAALAPRGVRTFVVPPLDESSAAELVKRAIPSLPDRLTEHLLARTGRRPGALRSFVKRLAGHAITSTEEIDDLLDATSSRSVPPPSRSREEALGELARALDTGRFDTAARRSTASARPRTRRRRSTSRSRARRSSSRAATRSARRPRSTPSPTSRRRARRRGLGGSRARAPSCARVTPWRPRA